MKMSKGAQKRSRAAVRDLVFTVTVTLGVLALSHFLDFAERWHV
jgi:hypothetical protein